MMEAAEEFARIKARLDVQLHLRLVEEGIQNSLVSTSMIGYNDGPWSNVRAVVS